MSETKKSIEVNTSCVSKETVTRWHSLRSPRLLPQSDKAIISSDLLVQLHGAEFCASLSDIMLSPLHTAHNLVNEMQNNNKESEEEKSHLAVVQHTFVEPLQHDLSSHYGSHAIRRGRAKTLGICFGRRASRLQGKSHVARNAHLWMPAKMHRRWCHRCGIRLVSGITAGCVDKNGKKVTKATSINKEKETTDCQCNSKERKTQKLGRRVCFRCFAENMSELEKKVKTKNRSKRRIGHETDCINRDKENENVNCSAAAATSLIDNQVKHCVRVASTLSRVQRNRRKQLSWQERRKRAKKETNNEHKEIKERNHSLITTDVTVGKDTVQLIENVKNKQKEVRKKDGTSSNGVMQETTTAKAIVIDQRKVVTPKKTINTTHKENSAESTNTTASANNKQIINEDINNEKSFDNTKTDIVPPITRTTTTTTIITQIRNRSSRHHNLNCTVNNTKVADNKTINRNNRAGQVSSQMAKSKQSVTGQKKAFDVMSKLGF